MPQSAESHLESLAALTAGLHVTFQPRVRLNFRKRYVLQPLHHINLMHADRFSTEFGQNLLCFRFLLRGSSAHPDHNASGHELKLELLRLLLAKQSNCSSADTRSDRPGCHCGCGDHCKTSAGSDDGHHGRGRAHIEKNSSHAGGRRCKIVSCDKCPTRGPRYVGDLLRRNVERAQTASDRLELTHDVNIRAVETGMQEGFDRILKGALSVKHTGYFTHPTRLKNPFVIRIGHNHRPLAATGKDSATRQLIPSN
ncbi:hypothetical protein RHODOP_03492 [Rhodoplanes sp. P11]